MLTLHSRCNDFPHNIYIYPYTQELDTVNCAEYHLYSKYTVHQVHTILPNAIQQPIIPHRHTNIKKPLSKRNGG